MLSSRASAFAGSPLHISRPAAPVRPARLSVVSVEAVRICQMTGKKRNKANKVCFSNKKSRVFQEVNLQVQRQAVSMTSPLHHSVSRAREPRAWTPDCAPCGCCGAGAASVGGLSLDTGRLADILAQRIPREERRAGGIGHREYALRGTLHQALVHMLSPIAACSLTPRLVCSTSACGGRRSSGGSRCACPCPRCAPLRETVSRQLLRRTASTC